MKSANQKFYRIQIKNIEELPSDLKSIIDAGVEECNGVVYLKKIARLTPQNIPGLTKDFQDSTGIECAINKIHIEDLLGIDEPYRHEIAVSVGVAFTNNLANALRSSFPFQSYRLILTEEEGEFPSVVFRLHKIRVGESWLADDIESYNSGVFIVETV